MIRDNTLSPVILGDEARSRLGYRVGYFGRTMVVLAPRHLAIEIRLEEARIAIIFPQPRCILAQTIVTGTGIVNLEHT